LTAPAAAGNRGSSSLEVPDNGDGSGSGYDNGEPRRQSR
jgi:hypothetical protein